MNINSKQKMHRSSARQGRDFLGTNLFQELGTNQEKKNKSHIVKIIVQIFKMLFPIFEFCFFINVPFAKDTLGTKI